MATVVTVASKVRNSFVKDLGVTITSTKTFQCAINKDHATDMFIYMLSSKAGASTAYAGSGLKLTMSTGDFHVGSTTNLTLNLLTSSSDKITGFHVGPFDSLPYAQIAATTTSGFKVGDTYLEFAFLSINSSAGTASTDLNIGSLLYVAQSNLI